MKKMMFIFGVLLTLGFSAQAQVSANVEFVRGLQEGTEGVGIGVSGQYLYPISEKLGVGANAGFIYGVGQGEGVSSFSVPVLVVGRYYVTGSEEEGGFYPQLELGIQYDRVKVDLFGASVSASNTSGATQLAFGYKLASNWDFNARFGLLFSDGNSAGYVGLRAGYTF